MQIHGFNKTTLLDFPGIVAATVFTGSCNFRCPFCQNADLVLDPTSQPLIPEEEVLNQLKKRKGITRGLCITGGEPTLQKDLRDFILKVKEIGTLVKLDTNGYRPEVLISLCEEGLIDYVAMDYKTALSDYSRVAGVNIDTDRIKESRDYLLTGKLPYEFRTTVVRELHSKEIMEKMASEIQGAKAYFLQSYVDSDRVIQPGFTSYSKEELEELKNLFVEQVDRVEIRGVD